MADFSSVLSDNSLLSRLDRRFHALELQLAFISGIAVFGLVMLAVISVGGRNFFNQPLPGYVDWIEQIMPLIAFMGIAYVQRNGSHVRMDILVGHLKGRVLWANEFVTILAILIVMLLIVWGSWEHFQRSFEFDATLVESGQLNGYCTATVACETACPHIVFRPMFTACSTTR